MRFASGFEFSRRLDASMVSNDHNYFVFEDLLHDVTHLNPEPLKL
jgi:hypothetical protein